MDGTLNNPQKFESSRYFAWFILCVIIGNLNGLLLFFTSLCSCFALQCKAEGKAWLWLRFSDGCVPSGWLRRGFGRLVVGK